MSGDKSIFFDLDESYQDFVNLDDESKVFVMKKKGSNSNQKEYYPYHL
jgi:hypothetical protein